MSNTDFVRRALERWKEGKLEEALADADPEIEWVEPPDNVDASSGRGREWVATSLASWSDQFASLDAELTEVREQGDKVFSRLRQAVRPHGGSVSLENDLFMIWTFRDGKAVRMEMFNDLPRATAAFEGE